MTEWVGALTRTLRAHGCQEQADRLDAGSTSVTMAHYRGLFAPYVPQDDWDVPFPEGMALTGGAVGENIMDNIQRHASDPSDSAEAARDLAELRVEPGPEQGPYAPVRLVVAMLGRLGPVARSGFAALSSTGVFHLGQVAAYLDDESVRERAIESVLSRVTADTRAVMAHSLGTVVAYEALHRLGRPLPLLVTFGSPLGLRSIIRERLRPQPLRTPDGLGRWVNVADRDDYIVSTLRLRTLFPETDDVLERTHLVKNANADPHAALEYLKHWETVAPLARVL